MGTVYEVRHPEIPRSLALKLVRSDVLDETTRERFLREGEALAAITHPNVVSVHQLESFGRQLVLVTELVEGVSLQERLNRQGPLPPEEAREVLRGVASALRQLHARGLIHRDLKPDNVILRPDGTPVVIDFGLARQTHSGSNLTQTGEILGTPSFMAPEQARDSSRADARSDVFALGALLFACLAAQPPFSGPTTLVILDKLLREPPEWPGAAKSWPRDLRDLCEVALSKDPAQRPADAEQFLAALNATPTRRAPRWILGVAVLCAAGVLGGAYLLLPRARGPADQGVVDSIRLGKAPLPTPDPNAASPNLQCWSSVRSLLAGEPESPQQQALAKTPSPAGHALGAALAARAGDRIEVERRLERHGKARRLELRLLPFLAEARAAALSRGSARRVLRLSAAAEPGSDLNDLSELRGLISLAQCMTAGDAPALASSEDETLPVWAREEILILTTRSPLDEVELGRIAQAIPWLRPTAKAAFTKQVGELVSRIAPDENQARFEPARVRLLGKALDTYRALAPPPAPVPKAEALVKYILSSGVDLIKGSSATQTPEDFDLALSVAEAFPRNALVQSAAGQSVWHAHLSTPQRWTRLLKIARCELKLLEGEQAATALGRQRRSYRHQTLERIFRLLAGVQEALPPPKRDPAALAEARRVSQTLREANPEYDDFQIDQAYLRFLLGELTQAELDAIPAEPRTVRLDLIRFAMLPTEKRLAAATPILSTLSYAKREVTPGILLHRATADFLWPADGPSDPSAARALPVIELAAKTLEDRHHGLSLHWRIQAARLARATSRERCQARCASAAAQAIQFGWREFADALTRAAKDPLDETLVGLATRALELPATRQE